MGCATSTPTTTTASVANNELESSKIKYPIVGSKDIMRRNGHGTSKTPVQFDLRWDCERKEADKICNFNRHYAENAGTFHRKYPQFKKEFQKAKKLGTTMKFYDSNTGNLLFEAPNLQSRTHDEFWKESIKHGWPSFRDNEVNWDYMRCLPNGESVSIDGTHLGHNLPDKKGNRYCINLVSVCGRPTTTAATTATEEEEE